MSVAVTDGRPPLRLVRMINPINRAVLLSPLGHLIAGLAVLHFEGRRTHRKYRVVTGWYQLDGDGVVFTPARWRSSFAGGAEASVRHRGRSSRLVGVLETDPSIVATALQRTIDAGTSPRGLGLRIAPGHTLSAADVEQQDRAMIRFREDGAARRP
jgi:hypothetical protein